jgi:competence protein ComEA
MRRTTRNQIRSRLSELIDADEQDVLLKAAPSASRPLGFVFLIALLVTVFVVAGQWPRARALPVAVASASSEPDSAGLVISVSGEVAKPGLYTLALGTRVADAIEAAGGASIEDIGNLNLAARLVDGQQIIVGATSATTSCINLNQADVSQLDQLPGIGPVMAARIVSWRTAGHVFSSLTDLQDISGIGPSLVAKIGDSACV